MLLSRFEWLLMNNPIRAVIQRRLEARWLLDLGGTMPGGRALEIGCGRGVGAKLILDHFGPKRVDAFDLDPKMVELAGRRLTPYGERVRLWTGDATAIDADEATYDAVFDFGIIHHVPDWRQALAEAYRVLRPGGRFYVEEVFARFILNPLWRWLFDHPTEDRFDFATFEGALEDAGFQIIGTRKLGNAFGWFVADKPPA